MTEIEVYNGTQLLGTLDINDVTNFPLAFTKSIVDYRNITQRGSTFSKPFRVTASNNNNRVLGFIYNANINGDFARDCRVKVNGLEILIGKIKVLAVYNDNDPAEYELAIFSEASDWFIDLQNKTVRDYDYGHTLVPARFNVGNDTNTPSYPASNTDVVLDYAHIEYSWTQTYADGWDYVFPLISYGQPDAGTSVRPIDMRPSLYIQGILRKAFADIGYTFNSQFFTTGIGSKLILPFTGDNFVRDDIDVENDSFDVKLFSSGSKTLLSNAIQVDYNAALIHDTEVSDPTNLYNTSTGQYTTRIGNTQLRAKGSFIITPIGNVDRVNFNILECYIDTGRGLGSVTYNGVDLRNGLANIEIAVGKSIRLEYDFKLNATFDSQQTNIFKLFINSTGMVEYFSSNPINANLLWVVGSSFEQVASPDITENQTFEVSTVFEDVKVMDLIKGLANMFNLYFQTDIAGKSVLIEPRQAFYDFTTNVDWSEKLDVNNQIQIINNDNYNRIVTFAFGNDTADEFVQLRNTQNNGQLGSFQLDLGNQFDKGIETLGAGFFAPTINNDSHPFSQTGISIPCMWGEPFNNPPKEYGFKQRILYYEGRVDQYISLTDRANWNWGVNTLFTLPYSYQFDNSFNPVINSTDRINLYYNGTGGLVDTYYRPDIAIIRDRKIIACYIYLKTIDIITLDFGKPVYFNHELLEGEWIINQIVDYQPNSDATTLVELVKNLQYPQISFDLDIEVPQVTSSKMGLGNGTVYGGEASNSGAVLHNGSGNVGIYNGGGVVIGNGLIQSVTNQHIFGNRNFQTDSLFVVGAGDLLERYNALQFTSDGEFLTQGGEIYVETAMGVVPVMYEKIIDGSTVTRYDIVVLASNIG